MRNFPFGYREVIPDQTLPEKWKEFTLNMGGSQFTLQETKVPDSSGGYSYKDFSNRFTRNRFIYWRIQRNELELVEHSLELNLVGNCVRYKFQNTLLLEGVSVHEAVHGSSKCVVVLVTTVSSVHRLSFPHPCSLHRQYAVVDSTDTKAQSVFSDASYAAARDPATFYVINNALTNVNIPHTSTSYLTDDGSALFALAYKTGLVMLIQLSESGTTNVQEMKEPRGFLSGLADVFKASKVEDVVPVSMVLHSIDNEVYLFSLCCGGNLRITPCYDKSKSIVVFSVNSHGNECHKCIDIRGVRRHVLRKAQDSANNRLYLGVFLYGRSMSEFCVLKPVLHEDGKLSVHSVARRFHDPKDHILIDLCVTRSRLWTLWHTQDEVPVVLSNVLDGDSPRWQQVILEQPPERGAVMVDPLEHPQQAYISYIFQPGVFPLTIIARALNVYQKSPLRGDLQTLGCTELECKVCQAMEEAVQEKVSEQDLSDEEKLRVAHSCWAQFCNSCISFHSKATKVVGLMVAQPADAIVLLKHTQFSLLRPMDALEHLLLMKLDTCAPEHFGSRPVLGDSEAVSADLIKLMCVVQALVSEAPEVGILLSKEVESLKTPTQVVEDSLVNGLVAKIPQSVLRSLENVCASTDVASAMRMLVGALACDFGEPLRSEGAGEGPGLVHDQPKMYSSDLGASTIARSLHQMAETRLSMCWSVLLCQKLLLSNNRVGLGLDSAAVTTLTNVYAQTGKLTQLYHVLTWLCRQTVAPCLPGDAGVAVTPAGAGWVKQLSTCKRRLTLVQLFFQVSPGESYLQALERLHCPPDKVYLWHCSMLSYVTTLGALLWPASRAHSLLHLMAFTGQQTLLEGYDRQLEWLDVSDHECKFLVACSYLASGQHVKALHMFESAAQGDGDKFFHRTLRLDPADYASHYHLLVAYYTKVISMFELRNHHECVIQLAVRAISNMPDKHSLATLKSVLFNQYVQLRRFREAYEAMSTNPDPLQQECHLRQLVLRLFDQERLDLLLEFSTQGVQEMQDKVEGLVRCRAQTSAVQDNMFYKFLLVFYLEQGNTRKAACVMYEQALRLGLETGGDLRSLQLQADCYVACISLLRAGQPKYAWIVKPVLEKDVAAESPCSEDRAVEVLELKEIEREYALVKAHLQLIRCNPERNSKGGMKSVSEVVAQLNGEGLYRAALELCQVFGTSAESVVEGLATDCVSVASSGDESHTWQWLGRNNVADLGLAGLSAQDVVWKLLQWLVEHGEAPGASVLHKAVARRLCLLAAFLPDWLSSSYKRRNPAELLRVLLSAGRLADAARLAEEYVWAVLGHGKEHFGLECALVAAGPPQVYLPTLTINLLLRELHDAGRDDRTYLLLHGALQQLMAFYLETVMRVSHDKLKAAACTA